MGLLSSIVSTAKKVVSAPVKAVSTVVKAVASFPSTVKTNVTALATTLKDKPVTAVLTGLALTNPATAPLVSATAISQTPKKTIKTVQAVTTTQAIVGAGAVGIVASVPLAVGTAGIVGASSALSQLETAPKTSPIVKKAEEIGITSTKDLISKALDNPLTTATALAVLPAVAIGISKTKNTTTKALSNATINENLKDIQKELKTEVPKELPSNVSSLGGTTAVPASTALTGSSAGNPVPPPTPITPETKPLIATAGGNSGVKRKKRRKTTTKTPIMRQTVNVAVGNKHYSINRTI